MVSGWQEGWCVLVCWVLHCVLSLRVLIRAPGIADSFLRLPDGGLAAYSPLRDLPTLDLIPSASLLAAVKYPLSVPQSIQLELLCQGIRPSANFNLHP